MTRKKVKDPSKDPLYAAYFTPEMVAYRATPEFKAYIDAREAWEAAHTCYCQSPTDQARRALLRALKASNDALKLARATPEHFAAFGH